MNQSIGIGDITNDYLYLSSDTNQLQVDYQSIDKIITTHEKNCEQAGAELGQAQVKLGVVDEVLAFSVGWGGGVII